MNKKTVTQVHQWTPKFARAASALNALLREAAAEGVKPVILVHENAELLGKDVQVVEVSIVMGLQFQEGE